MFRSRAGLSPVCETPLLTCCGPLAMLACRANTTGGFFISANGSMVAQHLALRLCACAPSVQPHVGVCCVDVLAHAQRGTAGQLARDGVERDGLGTKHLTTIHGIAFLSQHRQAVVLR